MSPRKKTTRATPKAATAGPAVSTRTEPPILLTTVNLNHGTTDDGKDVWQFVYASQLYGTLFGIYANFGVTTNTDGVTINKLRLKLVNYQGVLNIGFTDDPPVFKEKSKKFYFGVRGGSIITDPPAFTFPQAIEVKKVAPYMLTFCRMLYPMTQFGFSLGDRPKPAEELDRDVPGGSYFDSEFYSRSGYDYFNGVDRPGMYNYMKKDLDSIRSQSDLGSPRCHEGIANLTA